MCVDMLVLDVCLAKFWASILSIVDICLLLVVQEFFLCVHLSSVRSREFYFAWGVIYYLFVLVCR